jgi:hypothetical protein
MAKNGPTTFSELAELDSEIRDFLALIMSEDDRGDVFMITAITLCIR